MNQPAISIKLLIGSLICGAIIFLFTIATQVLGKDTKIVFCDVGQGDATYIRIKNSIDMLIDAGPDNSVLTCLGKYMPFYDHTIEIALLTHPDKDHLFGFVEVVKRYSIKTFFINPINKDSETFRSFLKAAQDKHISFTFPVQGDLFKIAGVRLLFYWPTQSFIDNQIRWSDDTIWGNPLAETNDFSFITLLQMGNQSILSTGDTSPSVLNTLSEDPFFLSTVPDVSILKVPHHGSQNGLTRKFLELADPRVSMISVGKRNSYGHPSKSVLDMFEATNRIYLRTDKEGSIVFSTDGRTMKRIK